jgi:GST-like protein
MAETRRLLTVINHRVSEAEYLAEEYSVADTACYPIMPFMFLNGFSVAEFPALAKWVQRIGERPSVRKVMESVALSPPEKYVQQRAKLSSTEWSNLFGENQHAAVHNH